MDSLERLELLGAGSSGKVYHVQQRDTKEQYALKVIPMDCSKAARIALLDELRAMSRLTHPNIVSCPDAFLVDGILFVPLHCFFYQSNPILVIFFWNILIADLWLILYLSLVPFQNALLLHSQSNFLKP